MRRWLLFVCFLLASCGATSSPATNTPSKSTSLTTGLIVGRQDDLWRLDLPAKQWTQLTSIAPNEIATYPSVAPDGAKIAFMYRPPLPTPSAEQPYIIPTTSINVMPINGGSHSRVFAPESGVTSNEKIFDTVETPAWSPDGTTLYATYKTMRFDLNDVFLRSGQDIIAINAADGTSQTLATNGTFPAPAPNGKHIAFVRTLNDVEPHLMLYDVTSKSERELFFSTGYGAMESPVWSPDGATIYFAASPNPTSGERHWYDWLLADTAAAHGLGWKVLAYDVATSKAREVNQQIFEDPRIVVRGDQLLVWSLSGLWQVDAINQQATPIQLIEQGDVGGIAPIP